MQKSSPLRTSARKQAKTVKIELEVEPMVELKLRLLCRQFNLPYPEGIAIVLENACKVVSKRKKGNE